MKIVQGGVTAPRGFLAAAVSCGIKKGGGNDLALLFSEVTALCSAAFTTNRIKSGSVILSEQLVKKGIAQAVLVNSGNANCCVGNMGITDARRVAGLTANGLGLDSSKVLIASTGIIGRPLPVRKIESKIAPLIKNLSRKNSTGFSKAIMTTDTVHKEAAVSINIGARIVTIGGAAKGSGMICPNMATMLAFFTTDASIERYALMAVFKECVSDSFNRITVDGDMSTNDTAIIFANGLSGNRPIRKGGINYFKFLDALKFVAGELARKIVLDGEGATRFIEIFIRGARDTGDAEKIARHVADSNLIKTMIAGGDLNWGRVAASVGSSGVGFDKDKADIYFGKFLLMKNGTGVRFSRKALSELFRKREIKITVDLKSGKGSFNIWTCDLTEEYVRINSDYET